MLAPSPDIECMACKACKYGVKFSYILNTYNSFLAVFFPLLISNFQILRQAPGSKTQESVCKD